MASTASRTPRTPAGDVIAATAQKAGFRTGFAVTYRNGRAEKVPLPGVQGFAQSEASAILPDGSAIAAEAQQKVFEPFYSTKSRGTGLGLAIVQRRAVEMGGLVELISPLRDGRGTQFRLVLPIAALATEDAPVRLGQTSQPER